ncbi:MAG: fumarylacetoacetate hydrolase family protein, partial [Acetobacteraceae bacterium]|nr:fumarylacetoacetate hydrolase family protein [Acetobacteraceae bacterium]
APGAEKPALLDAAGTIRDLSGHVREFDAETLSGAGLQRLRQLEPSSLPALPNGDRIGPCVPRPMNFICIGLNYADHAAETGAAIPKEPIVFLKSLGAFQGPNDDVRIPRGAKKTDWEVELAIIIGEGGDYIPEHEAMDHVAGYCIVNDVSEREYQTERGGTWDKGKGCPTFGPTGPWLVTTDEIPDPHVLDMFTEIDGKRMQNGNTRTMIFNVPKLVSYCSDFMRLYPGDIISTGTPPGVGMGIKPQPIFLKGGETMRLGIQGLGEQVQKVVAA